jgi:2,3-bisphosphoglycerate-independent phosphoglycerate mutase
MAANVRPRHPVLLIVIDGWGHAPPTPDNAIAAAAPVHMERLAREYPSTVLEASGEAVGLPAGQMGNSEVGHLNIGAGRVVDQDFVRITRTTREGRLGEVAALRDIFAYAREGHALHVLGLLGPGGVHSHEEHLVGLLEAAQRAGVPRVWVHHVLDGRDTPPQSAREFAARAQAAVDRRSAARVATVSGRYWTMDRDKRWDRTERAYRMLTGLEGHRALNAATAIEAAYARGETDEFVAPTVMEGAEPIREGDAILVYNFRPDRVRQIVRALADPSKSFRPIASRPASSRSRSTTAPSTTWASTSRSRPSTRGAPWANCTPRRACVNCESPRRRSTPTSRTSSAEDARRPSKARTDCSSPAPRSPRTTRSPR